jgi:hypothetical protein
MATSKKARMVTMQIKRKKHRNISKMDFGHWKSPGVSERMWSVNLDALITGEYQRVGGYCGRPSKK